MDRNLRGIGGLLGKGGGSGQPLPDVLPFIDNLTELEQWTLTNVPKEGQMVWVATTRCAWILSTFGYTPTPDGITIVAALGYVGTFWYRLTGTTDVYWLGRNLWYIDPVNGNDEDDGFNGPTAAIKTLEEFNRRVSVGAIKQTTEIRFVEAFTGEHTIEARLVDDAQLIVKGPDPVVTLTGDTIAALTLRTHVGATPEATLLQLTTLADWTPHVAARVRSGALLSWVLKQNPGGLGANVARVSPFHNSAGVEATPAVGAEVEIETLTYCAGSLLFRVSGSREPAGTFRLLKVVDLWCDSLRFEVSGAVELNACAHNGVLSGWTLGTYDVRSFFASGCTEQNVYPFVNVTGGAGIQPSFAGAQHVLNLARCTWQDDGTNAVINLFRGMVSVNDVQIFDAATPIRMRGTASLWIGGSAPSLSGTGNTRGLYISDVSAGGNIGFTWPTAATPNLKGSTAEITIVQNGITTNLAWATCKYDSNQQQGTATLVAGTATVTARNANTAGVSFSRNTPGGVVGDLSVPAATRTAAQFVINSANAGDTSTVDWMIPGFGPAVYVGPYNTTAPPV